MVKGGVARPMASIHDIARHTGLSAATISRYLNKRPYVSKEAQLTIELAMEQLGYHPNASARSLRSGKTGRVVVVVNRVNHPFFATLLSGIGEVAQKEGFDILIQQTAAANWSPTLLEEQVAARSMDGIIVTAETRTTNWRGFWERSRSLHAIRPSLTHHVPRCTSTTFRAPWTVWNILPSGVPRRS